VPADRLGSGKNLGNGKNLDNRKNLGSRKVRRRGATISTPWSSDRTTTMASVWCTVAHSGRCCGSARSPKDCEAFFRANEDAFRAAAGAKILRETSRLGVNLHLTSRDVARQIKK